MKFKYLVEKRSRKYILKQSYKLNQILDVTVQKIIPNGFGLAFAENLTVFVPLSVAGDELSVKIKQLKGKTAFAEIVRIIKPSINRIEPPCEYFGRCGGCDFQQMPYEKQLEAKLEIIKDSLLRIGKIKFENEIKMIPSPREFGYRSRVRWHADTRQKKVGYFQRNSHNVIDIEQCPILTEDLQKVLTELRETIEWESFWAEIVEIEAANSGDQISIFSDEIIEPTEQIELSINTNNYFFNAQTFFQGNQFLIENLIETSIGGASGKNALDLYSGVGLFSLPLAKKFRQVTAVEASERAVEFARINAERAEVENVNLICEQVNDYLSENNIENADFILLDPPRSGTDKETIENILKINPAQISYVACEPSTLARDLRILTENNYQIESITAIDLFPQTHHIETVVRLFLL